MLNTARMFLTPKPWKHRDKPMFFGGQLTATELTCQKTDGSESHRYKAAADPLCFSFSQPLILMHLEEVEDDDKTHPKTLSCSVK